MNFDQAFEQLIGHEGGYVNNSNDRGGETKFGISKRSYPALDIKSLTLDNAKAIYRTDYWDKCMCDRLPALIRFDVFDTAVNSGVRMAIRLVQKAMNLKDDGVIGPITLEAINRANGVSLSVIFNAERLIYMTSLTDWQYFGKGWARRVASNLKIAIERIDNHA